MSLTPADVERVALLARLRFTADELATLTRQLARIVDYVNLLSELDTSQVEPMAHAVEMHNVFRPDELEPGLARDEALANAPSRDEECFLVPAVLGD